MKILNTKEEILLLLRNNKNYLVRTFGIEKIAIFGSFARNTQREDSDVDIMVECKKEYKRYDLYLGLKNFLKDNIGREVEIVYENSMNPIIKIQAAKEYTHV